MVHSSLSKCGYFVSGRDAVLDNLRKLSGTLCMPTHTYCYPEGPLVAPLFDAHRTPSLTGILPEALRRRSDAVRSIHATHSVVACGPLAGTICKDHYKCDSPCGTGTPFDRLVQLRASVLMLGVSFEHYTLFHTVEFQSGSECAYEHGTLDRLRVIDEHQHQRVCLSRRQSRTPTRYGEVGALLERIGLARRTHLERGFLLFVPDCSMVHALLLERLKLHSDYLRQSCSISLV